MRAAPARVLAQLDFRPGPRPARRVARLSPSVSSSRSPRRCGGSCRIFILDEPTAALEKREIERLFSVLARMKAQGTAIIYISHRLDEVVAHRRPLHRAARWARRGGAAGAARSPCTIWCSRDDRARGRRRRAAPAASGQLLLRGAARRARDAVRLRAGEVDRLSPVCSAAAPAAMLRGLFGVAGEPITVTSRGEARRLARPGRRHRCRHRHGAGRAAARPGDEPVGARQHPAAQPRRAVAAGVLDRRPAIASWPS